MIYCQRHGCFASTKQNEIKVSIKNLNKLCKRPQPALGSNTESLTCHVPAPLSSSPCCAQHPQAALALQAVTSAGERQWNWQLRPCPYTADNRSVCQVRRLCLPLPPVLWRTSKIRLPTTPQGDAARRASAAVSFPGSKRSSGLRGGLAIYN